MWHQCLACMKPRVQPLALHRTAHSVVDLKSQHSRAVLSSGQSPRDIEPSHPLVSYGVFLQPGSVSPSRCQEDQKRCPIRTPNPGSVRVGLTLGSPKANSFLDGFPSARRVMSSLFCQCQTPLKGASGCLAPRSLMSTASAGPSHPLTA